MEERGRPLEQIHLFLLGDVPKENDPPLAAGGADRREDPLDVRIPFLVGSDDEVAQLGELARHLEERRDG